MRDNFDELEFDRIATDYESLSYKVTKYRLVEKKWLGCVKTLPMIL